MQVAIGSVAPLCISYLTEAKARSAFARTRGWRYSRPYECCGLVITLLVLWIGCAVLLVGALEACYAYVKAYLGVSHALRPMPQACSAYA
jgi:hypothetical protein